MLMALLPSNEPALQTPLWGSRSGPPDSLPATRAGMALRPSKFPFPNQLTPSPIPPCTCRPLDSSPASTQQSFSALPCLSNSVCSAFLTAPEAIRARHRPWLQHLPQPPSGVSCPLLITLALPLPRPHTHRAPHPPSPVPPSQFAIQPTAI